MIAVGIDSYIRSIPKNSLEIIFPCHLARMCLNIRGVLRILRISGHATHFTALSYKRPSIVYSSCIVYILDLVIFATFGRCFLYTFNIIVIVDPPVVLPPKYLNFHVFQLLTASYLAWILSY